MRQAAKFFIGKHDFRNFSKIDLTNSIDFEYLYKLDEPCLKYPLKKLMINFTNAKFHMSGISNHFSIIRKIH